MNCHAARARLSEYRDGELAAAEARLVAAHLARCGGCGGRWRSLGEALDLLADLPRLDAAEEVVRRVQSRLEVERRGPGLALLFRSAWAARPLILPSLVPAALLLVLVVAGAFALDRWGEEPLPPVAARGREAERPLPPSGTEGNPLFPSAEVSTPRTRGVEHYSEAMLDGLGGDSLFLETVVARDGTVSAVTVLEGDGAAAAAFLDALRRERFEPGRFRGRPVAVSVYRLISRMEVRPPLT